MPKYFASVENGTPYSNRSTLFWGTCLVFVNIIVVIISVLIFIVHLYSQIRCIGNKEELLDPWNESVILPDHKMSDKTDCNTYRGISLL
jgi:hypothetical protein